MVRYWIPRPGGSGRSEQSLGAHRITPEGSGPIRGHPTRAAMCSVMTRHLATQPDGTGVDLEVNPPG